MGHTIRELSLERASEVCQGLRTDMGLEPCAHDQKHKSNGKDVFGPTSDKRFQQALTCVSLVFDGAVPDPTNGASRVHPHDQQPAWAQSCEPTALIGDLLFFKTHASAREKSSQDSMPS